MDNPRRLIIFLVAAVPICVWDIARMRIPDPLVAAGVLLEAASCLLSPEEIPSAAAGAVCGFALLWAVRRLVPDGMGFGDVKFAAFVGAMAGIRDLCLALFVASAGGLIVALAVRLLDRTETSRRIPFAPFLTLGGLVSLLAPQLGLAGLNGGGLQ